MTLYEMTTQANCLYDLLESGEIDEQIFNDTLEAIGTDEKLVSYCQVIMQMETDSQDLKNEIDRLSAKQKSIKNSIERLKETAKQFLIATGEEKKKVGSFSIRIAKSKKVNIIDENSIPKDYVTEEIVKKIDKRAITEAIKLGEKVNGAELVETKGLTIK